MATAQQLAANLLNAQQSTGPKTAEGKARSRANSRRHGLASEHPLLASTQSPLALQRKRTWMQRFDVTESMREMLVDLMVGAAEQLDLCWGELNLLQDEHALRAEVVWDLDRRDEVFTLAEKLSVNPWRVVHKLARTPHGCHIMIELWARLGDMVEAHGVLDPAQRSLALDLSGVKHELRAGPTEADPPAEVVDKKAWLKAWIQTQISHLESLIPVLQQCDDERRDAACDGGGALFTPKGALLQRYIRDAERRFLNAMTELHRSRPAPAPSVTNSVKVSEDEDECDDDFDDCDPDDEAEGGTSSSPDAILEDEFAQQIEDKYVSILTRKCDDATVDARIDSRVDELFEKMTKLLGDGHPLLGPDPSDA